MPPRSAGWCWKTAACGSGFASGADAEPFIGNTPAMLRIKQTLRHIADADVDVLVEGETGTGKEVVASALHRMSRRRQHELVAINCALPESVIESELFGHEAGAFTGAQKRRIGRIEHASGGTLFLDEIESMPLNIQVKFLRVLETRQITPLGTNDVRRLDLRVVAATKEDLGSAGAPAFPRRPVLSPERRHHPDPAATRTARRHSAAVRALPGHRLAALPARHPDLPAQVRQHLLEHAWPGNVRELAHFAERVVLGVHGGTPLSAPQPAGAGSLPERVERFEAQLIRDALAINHGDIKSPWKRWAFRARRSTTSFNAMA